MNLGDLLTPWLILGAILVVVVYVENWVHSHLYGIGWVITSDKKSATALYYLLLSPGVFVHEFTQYIVAGALNVKIKRVIAWPQGQEDGTLRLDFVQIKEANRVQAALIGAAPLFTGLAIIWAISTHILNLEEVLTALGTADLQAIGTALQRVGSTPDFYLWLYVLFTISNAMLPTPADRRGWPLVFLLFGGVLLFLVLIGVGHVLLQTFTGPVAHGVDLLSTAFLTVLIVEVPGMLLIAFIEELLERATKRKFQYAKESRSRSRQPGSSDPLPPDALLPSIYNLNLPIPMPVEQRASAPARSRPPSRTGPSPQETSPASPRLPRPVPEASNTSENQPPAVPRSPAPAMDVPPRQRTEFPLPRPEDPSAPPRDRPPLARPDREPARPLAGNRPGGAGSFPPRGPGTPSRTQPDPSHPNRPAEPGLPSGPPRVAGPPGEPSRPFERPAQRARPDQIPRQGQGEQNQPPRRQPPANLGGVFDRLSAPERDTSGSPPQARRPMDPRDRMSRPPDPTSPPIPLRRTGNVPETPARPDRSLRPAPRPAFSADDDEADVDELRYERFDDDAVQDDLYEDE